MKYETYSEYDPRHVALAEAAFLTVWAGVGRWRDELVLVGGLVPKYLCGDLSASRTLPRPATLDVDFGISLGADSGHYGSLRWELQGHGFKPNPKHPSRLEKIVGEFNLPVDFLVEHPIHTSGTALVEDIAASIMPGVDRALETAREISLSGIDLSGAEQNLIARVCEIGPFLSLKLRAFGDRQQAKDAFDILYSVLHYDKGTDAAISAFAEEVRLQNPACGDAMNALRTYFLSENLPGPVKASHFVLGQVMPSESADTRFMRTSIRQDMVDVAALLLKAADG